MVDRFCKKCNHLCHCIEADHNGCKCDGCECSQKGGLVIDDTNECDSCQ